MPYYIPVIILAVFTLVETLCGTYILKDGKSVELVSIIYFASGIMIGIIPLIDFKIKRPPSSERGKIFSRTNSLIIWGFFLLVSCYFIFLSKNIMENIVLDYRYSDMLPQIKVMCQRLLHNEKIYAPIQEIWNGKNPPYMPLMWLPFAPAEYAGIDMRWTSVVFILAGLFITLRIVHPRYNFNPLLLVIPLISLFLLFNFLLMKEEGIIGRTEEGVVIGFYLLLGYALVMRKPILIGIAIACCLLSRFSLFFWAPMYLVYVFFFESRKNAYTIASVIGVIVLFVFLIPFGFSQPEYFMNIPADYHVGVDRAWSANYKDGVYYGGSLGYTKWFDISQIGLLHYLQIIVSAGLPVILLLTYIPIRKKPWLNKEFFGLCTLKICLVFFYNMVEVPYYYLFFVSTFFSYSLLFSYLRYHALKSAVEIPESGYKTVSI